MKKFRFEPQDDVTPKELAEIFKVTMTAIIQGLSNRNWDPTEDFEIEEDIYKALSDKARRHFDND